MAVLAVMMAGCAGDDSSSSDAELGEPADAAETTPDSSDSSEQEDAGPVAPEWTDPEIFAKAVEEGEIFWYAGLHTGTMERMVEDFTSQTGGAIELQAIRLGGEAIFTRILQEFDREVSLADVAYTGSEAHFVHFKDEGILQPYESTQDDAINEALVDPDHHYYVPYTQRYVLAYNTDLLSPEEAPASWASLLDSEWNGKLALPHPSYSVSATLFPFLMMDLYGEDFVTDLDANDPLVVQSSHDALNAVITGERLVAIGSGYGSTLTEKEDGNPIDVVIPEEGAILNGGGAGILASAPHPNAARVLMDYILSQRAQQFIADINRDAVRDDVTYEGIVPPSETNNVVINPFELRDALERIKALFEEAFGV